MAGDAEADGVADGGAVAVAGAAEADEGGGDGAADFGRGMIGEGEVLLFHVLGGAFTSRHACAACGLVNGIPLFAN